MITILKSTALAMKWAREGEGVTNVIFFESVTFSGEACDDHIFQLPHYHNYNPRGG